MMERAKKRQLEAMKAQQQQQAAQQQQDRAAGSSGTGLTNADEEPLMQSTPKPRRRRPDIVYNEDIAGEMTCCISSQIFL